MDTKNEDYDADLEKTASLFACGVIGGLIFFFVLGFVLGRFSIPNENIKKEVKIVKVQEPVYIFLSDTIRIPNAGSLCGSLRMTEAEALAFAKKYNYPIRYDSWGSLNVILQPGELFIKNWQPDTLKYLKTN